MNKALDLTKDPVHKLFLRYLLPAIGATIISSIYVIADSVFIGKIVGADGMAALNIIIPMFNIFIGFGVLFGVGGAVLMAISFGEGNIAKGQKYFSKAVLLGIITTLIVWLILFPFSKSLINLFDASRNVLDFAYEYGFVIIFACPLFIFSTMLQSFVRNDKDPYRAMIGVITGGLLNILLDYIFMHYLKMGIRGAAVSTCIGTFVTILILSTHFFSKKNNLKITKEGFNLKGSLIVVTTGIPSFIVEASNAIVITVFNIQLLKYIGDVGITVYGIINNYAVVALSFYNGVSQASQPIVATNFGALKKERVRQAGKITVCYVVVIGFIFFIVGELVPSFLAKLFVDTTPTIIFYSKTAIRIYFIAFLFACCNIFACNYFQATMKAKEAFIISILRSLVLSLILILILPLIMGVNGIWWVIPLTEVITFIVMILIVRLKKNCEKN